MSNYNDDFDKTVELPKMENNKTVFPNDPEELGWRPKRSSNPFDGLNDTSTTEVPGFGNVSETKPLPKMSSKKTQTSYVNEGTTEVGFGSVNPTKQSSQSVKSTSTPLFPDESFMNDLDIQQPLSQDSGTLNIFGSSEVKAESNRKQSQFIEDVWDKNKDETNYNVKNINLFDDSNSGSDVPPINNSSSKKNKKGKDPKKGQFKKNPTALNIVVTLFTIIMNALVVFIMMNVTRYASISKNIFLAMNIGVLAALILLDLLIILMIRTKKVVLFVVSTLVVCLFLGAGGYGVYAINRANTSVNNLTATTKEENVSASLVIYSGTSGDPITDISDLEGRTVGVAIETKTSEIAKSKFTSDNINVTYSEYNGYTELLSALISGDVDCAVLPTSYKSQYEEDENLANYLPDTESILDFSDIITSTSEVGADKDITKEPFTVLVTGENEGLADSIILMSVNPISMKVTMTSIARDSYVPISCYGSSDKINSAHAASESCMVQTVENLMGIDIDYTIEFNFASVVQVVDAVGGVTVDVPVTFDAQCWNIYTDELAVFTIEAGENVYLDGARALGFVRERYAFADGDFARQRHQQEVIEQIIQKLLSSGDPQMFLNVLDAAGDNIKTNFTVEQMTGFINYALQKTKRYYNQDSIAGLFNFESSRVTGYSANLWNNALQMDLWIYRVWNGSVEDVAANIEDNMDLEATPDTPEAVSWSAADTFTVPTISQETYNETMITDDGRPDPTPTTETTTCPVGTELGADGVTCVPTATEEPTPTEEAHVHDTNGTSEVIQSATCTTDGITRYYCSQNDGGYTDITVPATGHNWVDNGDGTSTCSNCGDTKTNEG